MSKLKYVEVDVLKPNSLSIIDVARTISELSGVIEVDIVVKEVEHDVEKIHITIHGSNLNNDLLIRHIEAQGCAVHSLDRVIISKK